MESIIDTLSEARPATGSPVAVVAHTTKGKGVSYMEDDYKWHSRVPTEEEFAQAMRELDAKEGELP